jgi:hypothetical protein
MRSVAEHRAGEERRRYLASLSAHQKRAYNRVQLFLAAIGQYFVAKGEMTPIHHGELHRFFPDFAAAMGYRGTFYGRKEGRCRAIDISFPEKEGSVWFITPYDNYSRMDENARKSVHTKKARRAALNICKAWLPNWNWESVRLPD